MKSERLDMTQHRRSRVLRYGVLAATAAGALVLAGCSGSGSPDESAGGAQAFSFTFATSNNLESPYQTLADLYMDENPDVKITTNPTPAPNTARPIATSRNTPPGVSSRRALRVWEESDEFDEPPSAKTRAVPPMAK